MNIKHLFLGFLGLVALMPTVALSQDFIIQSDQPDLQQQYQILQSTPAVRQGKVLVKKPSINPMLSNMPIISNIDTPDKNFSVANKNGYSALDAYLAGNGPLNKEVLREMAGRPIIELLEVGKVGNVMKVGNNAGLKAKEGRSLLNQEEGSEMFVPKMLVKNWDRDELYLAPFSFGIQNIEDGMGCLFKVYDFDQEAQGYWEVVEGTYDAYAIFSVYTNDEFEYLGMAIVMNRIYLSSEDPLVVLDANEIKNTLTLNSYLPDGTPFPYYKFDPENPNPEIVDTAFESTLLDVEDYFAILGMSENPHSIVMCNDLIREINVTKSIVYLDPEDDVYMTIQKKTGAFDNDLTFDMPLSQYRTYSSSFCLTEEDRKRACGVYVNGLAYAYDGAYNSGISVTTPKSLEDVSVQCCFDENDFAKERYIGVLLGIGMDNYMYEIKNGGVLVNTPEGMVSCINIEYWPCFWFPEITRTQKPEQYYTKALYLNGTVRIRVDRKENTITGVYGSLEARGPENEHTSGIDAAKYLKSMSINNSSFEPEEIIGQKLTNGDMVGITYVYDDILVDRSLPSTTSLTIGFGVSEDSNADKGSPILTYYQIRNEKGEVVNSMDPHLGGKLYVIVDDESSLANITVSLSPVDANDVDGNHNEWNEISLVVPTPEPTDMGNLYTLDLSGMDLESEQWYNLHIYAEDSCGNYMDQTIENALKAMGTTGIKTISSLETIDCNTVYYDLSGRIIPNPTKGIYIQEIKSSKGNIIRNKVYVK